MSVPTLNRFDLRDFVAESNRIEGIPEVRPGECAAHERFLTLDKLHIGDIVMLVGELEPGARPRFAQGLDVRVGSYLPPKGGVHIMAALQDIVDKANRRHTPAYDLHIEYEKLHPFTDGNGRSGRALWLWARGGVEHAPLGFLHHFYYETLQRA